MSYSIVSIYLIVIVFISSAFAIAQYYYSNCLLIAFGCLFGLIFGYRCFLLYLENSELML